MKSSLSLPVLLFAVTLAAPLRAQFLESPSPPPPSFKEQALPVVVETISGLPLVDESPAGAGGFIKNERVAVLLGKALFWDTQVGSQQVACATCHYHAGADARERNQLSPGLNGGNGVFDMTATGGGGANYELQAGDFPLRQFVDPNDRDSMVVSDSDDVVSSQGVPFQRFNDIVPGSAMDDCTPMDDPDGFQVQGINVRRVEPRNTPTVINAAFNHRNFWDGRANNLFNGVDPFGQRNTEARILEGSGDSVNQIQVAFENGSLASQAVGPPTSNFEMSCDGRTWPKIGKKMLSLEVLRAQRVHRNDSVLGHLSASPESGLQWRGDPVDYGYLIRQAFADRFWDSPGVFDADKNLIRNGTPATTDEYTMMEANFSFFFGLAVMAYERTLVSDDAPYDQWAEAAGDDRSPTEDNTQGILTASQMRGMDLFFTNTVGERGNCSTCHQGPAFSTATFPFTVEEESGEFPEQEQLVERMRMGDAVSNVENLFRFFIEGEGSVGGYSLGGIAGSRELPNRHPATVGGDFWVNGCKREVYSFLLNQDTRWVPNPGGSPSAIKVPDVRTRDAVFVLRGCREWLQVTLVDNGPTGDWATVEWIQGIRLPPPQEPPRRIIVRRQLASGPVDGDFTLGGPTLYDTAFYNIGVRPTSEDLGVGGTDPFGNPLSITQQWIEQLLGTPVSDVDAVKSLTFSRVAEPFSWYGDGVFFPGGLTGPEWPIVQIFPCPPGAVVPCTVGIDEGLGHEAYPLYPTGKPVLDFWQEKAIREMATGIGGAFKTPGLRNVTLTAPYFHNGGQLTLKHVMEFYNRGGDFATDNLGDLSPNIHPLDLDDVQVDDIVAFLEALTDRRVACEMAPFDHPEIRIQPGHQTDENMVTDDGRGQAEDRFELIPATGAGGRLASGLECLETENFLE